MRVLHLLWIIPASVCFGASIMALMIAGARADREMEKRDDESRPD